MLHLNILSGGCKNVTFSLQHQKTVLSYQTLIWQQQCTHTTSRLDYCNPFVRGMKPFALRQFQLYPSTGSAARAASSLPSNLPLFPALDPCRIHNPIPGSHLPAGSGLPNQSHPWSWQWLEPVLAPAAGHWVRILSWRRS